MKSNFILKPIPIILFAISGIISAQSAVLTSGNNAVGSSGTASYSVGQIAYQDLETPNGKVTQGVQQVYEILTLGNNETEKSKNITLYPNPVKDMLYVDFNQSAFTNNNVELYDAQGKLLITKKIATQKSEINFSDYPPSLYIIRIIENGKTIKNFKIIKK